MQFILPRPPNLRLFVLNLLIEPLISVFDLYFLRENLNDQCGVVFLEREELYVFKYSDMKFENEDNWGDDEE